MFCIAPFDLTIKMRKDLSGKLSTAYPRFTMSIELSALNLSIDNDMWADLMALGDLLSWHKTPCTLPSLRPEYRHPFNPRRYWKYAYKSVVRLIKDKKREADIGY